MIGRESPIVAIPIVRELEVVYFTARVEHNSRIGPFLVGEPLLLVITHGKPVRWRISVVAEKKAANMGEARGSSPPNRTRPTMEKKWIVWSPVAAEGRSTVYMGGFENALEMFEAVMDTLRSEHREIRFSWMEEAGADGPSSSLVVAEPETLDEVCARFFE